MYDIHVDRQHDIVEATLSGMMPVEEVASYISDLRRALTTHGLRDYALIIDASDCPIQSQDMTRAMGEHMATMPKARALAIITASSLARMQVRRLFTQPYARIVATLDEARAWVICSTEPSA